jgi:ABC-2 type transport system permease protein
MADAASIAVPRSRLWTLAKKELFSLVVSPISWIILALFYMLRGAETVQLLLNPAVAQNGDVDGFVMGYLIGAFQSTLYMAVLVPPILTMRAFAEEKRTGSLELLMTAPVRDYEVVLGKWLGAWVFYAILWTPTVLILAGLQLWLGLDIAYGQVFTSCLGMMSLGSLLLAAGLFTSSLTDNQLLASLTSILFGLGLIMVPPQLAATAHVDVDSPFYLVLLDQANVARQLQLFFFRGHVDTGHLAFYVSTTVLFLFLTVRVVESRKWR